ncbi:MAG TPA: hypothetical protein VIE39_01280 [Thermoanaerobaculia bacterium]|jgi:hypothetical protein
MGDRRGAIRRRAGAGDRRGLIPRAARAAALIPLLLGAAGCRESFPPGAAAVARALPSVADSGYRFRPAEARAVSTFLQKHAGLRLAIDDDRREQEEEFRRLYGVYHPYFVRGDTNDDGLLDFVLAFVHRGEGSEEDPRFSVVVFAGRADGSFEAEAFLEREVELADGDLAIDRDAILVTPDLSDEEQRRYRWDPARRSFVFVREELEEDEAPEAART